VAPSRIGAIGVGIAGHVDHTAGTVRHAVNLGIDGAPFGVRDALRARLGVPVVVDNDVRAAAVGAFHHLQASTGHDLRSLVYLGVGTGLSAGVILDGRLHRGRNNLAGEIGHVPAMAGGPPCRCGMVGCLEAVAAGPALKRAWPRGAGDLFRAAGAGDAGAGRIAEAFALPLARAVMWLTATYDPDVVVLGGGVGSASPLAAALVAAALRSLASGSELAGDVFAGGRLQSLDSDLPVGALGAATLALELISLPSDARQAEQAIQEEETNP
jgi:predicted NBD/HSP70 family sugar kinase